MGYVSLNINGRTYDVACDDGQEEHVSRLARFIDERLRDLAKETGNVSDAQLLLMVALLIADELSDTYDQLDKLEAAGASGGDQATLAEGLEILAQRVEHIAARVA